MKQGPYRSPNLRLVGGCAFTEFCCPSLLTYLVIRLETQLYSGVSHSNRRERTLMIDQMWSKQINCAERFYDHRQLRQSTGAGNGVVSKQMPEN
jgi:hypothetical protein